MLADDPDAVEIGRSPVARHANVAHGTADRWSRPDCDIGMFGGIGASELNVTQHTPGRTGTIQ